MRWVGWILCLLLAGCDVLTGGGASDPNLGLNPATLNPPDVVIALGTLDTVQLADQQARRWVGRPTSGTQATFFDFDIRSLTGCPTSGHDQTEASLNLLQFNKALSKWIYLASIPTAAAQGGTKGRVCVAISGTDRFPTGTFSVGLQETPGLNTWYRHIWDVPDQIFPTNAGVPAGQTRAAYLGLPTMAAMTRGTNDHWLMVAGRLENDDANTTFHEAFVDRSMVVGFPIYSILHQDLGTPVPVSINPSTANQGTYIRYSHAVSGVSNAMAVDRHTLRAAEDDYATTLPSEVYFLSNNGDYAPPPHATVLFSPLGTPPPFSTVIKLWRTQIASGPSLLISLDGTIPLNTALTNWQPAQIDDNDATNLFALGPLLGQRRRYKSVNLSSATRHGGQVAGAATVAMDAAHRDGSPGQDNRYPTVAMIYVGISGLGFDTIFTQPRPPDLTHLVFHLLPFIKYDTAGNLVVAAYQRYDEFFDSGLNGWKTPGSSHDASYFHISFGSRRPNGRDTLKMTNRPSLSTDPSGSAPANNFYMTAPTFEHKKEGTTNYNWWGTVINQFSSADYPP